MSLYNNAIWSFMNTIGVQIIVLITNVVLARLLYPEIFGVLGMATVITGLILLFQEQGLSTYLIFKTNVDEKIIYTTFWLNIIISFLLAGITFSTAPLIAEFYNNNDVGTIVKYISIGMLCGSFGITSRILLVKQQNFKKLTIIECFAEVINCIVSITLALNNQPLLAIASRLVIRPMVQSFLLLIVNRDKVIGKPQFNIMSEAVVYGIKILGSQILIYCNNNITYLIIGKILGNKSLGLYTVAFQWSVIARYYISSAIVKVAFPEISKIKDDISRVRHLYNNVTNKLSFITLPICLGLMAVTPEFVLVFYGSSWEKVVPILQLLLISGAVTSFGTVGGAIFNGLGRPEVDMKINIGSLISGIVFICLGSFYGIVGVTLGIVINSLIFETVKIIFVNKMIDNRFKDFIRTIGLNLMPSLLMVSVIYLIRIEVLVNMPNYSLKLIVLVLIGSFTYIVFSFFINKENFDWIYKKITNNVKKQIAVKES